VSQKDTSFFCSFPNRLFLVRFYGEHWCEIDRALFILLSFTEKKVIKESRPKIQINGFVVAQVHATWGPKPLISHIFGDCQRTSRDMDSDNGSIKIIFSQPELY
jgi:hypothetical protein